MEDLSYQIQFGAISKARMRREEEDIELKEMSKDMLLFLGGKEYLFNHESAQNIEYDFNKEHDKFAFKIDCSNLDTTIDEVKDRLLKDEAIVQARVEIDLDINYEEKSIILSYPIDWEKDSDNIFYKIRSKIQNSELKDWVAVRRNYSPLPEFVVDIYFKEEIGSRYVEEIVNLLKEIFSLKVKRTYIEFNVKGKDRKIIGIEFRQMNTVSADKIISEFWYKL